MKDNRRKAGSKAIWFPVFLLVLRGIHSALDSYQGLCTGRDGQHAVALLFFTSITNSRLPPCHQRRKLPEVKKKIHIIYESFVFLEI